MGINQSYQRHNWKLRPELRQSDLLGDAQTDLMSDFEQHHVLSNLGRPLDIVTQCLHYLIIRLVASAGARLGSSKMGC